MQSILVFIRSVASALLDLPDRPPQSAHCEPSPHPAPMFVALERLRARAANMDHDSSCYTAAPVTLWTGPRAG